MISLPTNSVTMGSIARTRRKPAVASVSGGLVRQIMAIKGGKVRSAPSLSRIEGRLIPILPPAHEPARWPHTSHLG